MFTMCPFISRDYFLHITVSKRKFLCFISQHIKEDDSDVHYFVIGSANYINPSRNHADQVKSEYVKFFWADSSKHGGFASFEINDIGGLTVTLLDSTGNELHLQTISPRNG